MDDDTDKYLEKLRKKLQANYEAEQAKQTKPTKPTTKKGLIKQQKRLERLTLLLAKLEAGNDVARRDLKNVLTDNEWEGFERDNSYIGAEELMRGGERPAGLDHYLEMVKKADLLYARAESTPANPYSKKDSSGRGGHKRLYDAAFDAYEKAIEELNAITSVNPDIKIWMDRNYDDTFDGCPSPERDCVPRLYNTRSYYALPKSKETKFDAKRENKQQALKNAIDKI